MLRHYLEFTIYDKQYICIFYIVNIYQMASRRRSSKKSSGKRRRGRRTEKKSHKWHQTGCQNQTGGGSMTGGWAWGPSDTHHQTAGSDVAPHSINGNHYAFNASTMAPPQASNAIVERNNMAAQSGGRRRRRGHGRGRGRSGSKNRRKSGASKSRRIACQNGGFMEYAPELAKGVGNSLLETPASIVNGLQGSATPFVTSSVTSQPIAKPVELK
jgi:hypothetical protein